MSNVLAIYPSHDSSICVAADGKFRVFELERLTKQRFYRFNNKENSEVKKIYADMYSIIKNECGVETFDVCYTQGLPSFHKNIISNNWRVDDYKFVGHHISHAASSFYQSNFDKALVISYDGGGYEGEDDQANRVTFFNVYIASKDDGIKRIHTSQLNLGTGYGLLGIPISEISKTRENWEEKFLGFAGKKMGLAAYGNVRDEWVEPITKYYYRPKWLQLAKDLDELGSDIKLGLQINALSGNLSYDLAATSQFVFENIAIKEMQPFLENYPDLPICLTGGCALNILFNQKLHSNVNRPIFVPPNPSDCGLAFGMAALHVKPKEAVDLMYSGFPILDFDKLEKYVTKYNATKIDNIDQLIDPLLNGKIIGIVRGNSEHGPRALGNRSILCNPSISDMKDTLNSKVKYREWFRPFAPIVRDIDVSEYFDFNGTSKYMSYSPLVKEEYRNKLQAIVHVDNTSRIQTVAESDNKFIYDLLGKFKEASGTGVLLNTSFNIKGLPILTTIDDALKTLRCTDMDMVLIENYLFKKENT